MQPFRTLTGVAAPLLEDDINTDQIAPGKFLRDFRPDYGKLLFGIARYRQDGTENPDFVLNKPQYRSTKILVTGANFGCGSSREQAVWAMTGAGISCIVARSFADIYRENCLKNGVLPITLGPAAAAFEQQVLVVAGTNSFTVNLENREIFSPDGSEIPFEISDGERHALMHGLDDIGLTLELTETIEAWESATRAAAPWLQAIPGREGLFPA